ncbi:hypothetical protein ASPBRDRAFT_31550 [Aspergillus brasiliensis CBS 101740]|uniref:Uncharacterized protein n=1 Tax=Aspergillus brasiliensis (strain CBS 101740 / IMI 381727 / IBT 21946) TaxID=767769 RepID=A0A1L9UG71_ASPBC|nr:hypothetical protein ASPBRDRAFT_31550 [Aspergillus brasiliensis CBS 101740]
MSAYASTMTEVMISEVRSQALLMPTHHFTMAVDAYGLEGRSGRDEEVVGGGGEERAGGGSESTSKHPHITMSTTTHVPIASASASGPAPSPDVPLHELFGVLRRYENFNDAKVLVIGNASSSHYLDKPLEKIELIVNTDVPPVTLRNHLRSNKSKKFSESGALGCAIKMSPSNSYPIICTLETITTRQLSRPSRNPKRRILHDAFDKTAQLRDLGENDIPFMDLPSMILMEVLIPPEPKTSIDAPLVWDLAQELDPQHEWEDWQRHGLQGKLTRLRDLDFDKRRSREEWCEALRLYSDGPEDGVEDEWVDGEEDEMAERGGPERVDEGVFPLHSDSWVSRLPWRLRCVGIAYLICVIFLLCYHFGMSHKAPIPEKPKGTWMAWSIVGGVVGGLGWGFLKVFGF